MCLSPKSAYRDTPETAEQRNFIARYIQELKSNAKAMALEKYAKKPILDGTEWQRANANSSI